MVALVLVLVLSGCIGGDSNLNSTTSTTLSESSRLLYLIGSNGSYRCSFNASGFQTDAWMGSGRFRAERNAPIGTLYTINDGVWVYSWFSRAVSGEKFRVSDLTNVSGALAKVVGKSVYGPFQNATQVECNATEVQDGLFTPPSNVSFTDLGPLINQFKNSQQLRPS
ncbi:MAG: hypothetical protein NTU61_02225 [Candidatus Altiarchaeota archaeon]|nr:hypothetical protein [Candidatus Altiarchaeota archaeon]